MNRVHVSAIRYSGMPHCIGGIGERGAPRSQRATVAGHVPAPAVSRGPATIEIRSFTTGDIAAVSALHRTTFGIPSPAVPDTAYRDWLTATFLDHPVRLDGITSLVAVVDGRLVGFLGVVPRRLALDDAEYRASVCSNFCVSADARGGIGTRLLERWATFPHDVAFVDEVGQRAQRLFRRCGWTVSPLQSVRWSLPLRPLSYALARLRPGLPGIGRRISAPIVAGLDALATRVPRSPFRRRGSGLKAEPMSAEALARVIREFPAPGWLRPVTTDGSTTWLVDRAANIKTRGPLHLVAARTSGGEIGGWFVYHAPRAAHGEVLQLVAHEAHAVDVFDTLVSHATDHGVASLSGTLHPRFFNPLGTRRAELHAETGARWMLVRTPHARILDAFQRGHLLLSRLDGEWPQHLR